MHKPTGPNPSISSSTELNEVDCITGHIGPVSRIKFHFALLHSCQNLLVLLTSIHVRTNQPTPTVHVHTAERRVIASLINYILFVSCLGRERGTGGLGGLSRSFFGKIPTGRLTCLLLCY